MSSTQPEIIAHRGFSAIAPENTLAGFRKAIEAGADSIECDLQLSADRVAVVFHDESLERTTGAAGKLKERSLEELKRLDAGEWKGAEFAGQQIPTLKEVLAQLQEIKKFIYLEVKRYCDWQEKDIENLLKMIAGSGLEEKCIITSFNEEFVEQVGRCSEQIKLGYIVAKESDYQIQLAKASRREKTVMVSEYHLLLENPGLIQASQDLGVEIVAWTVDSLEDMQKLEALGVRRIVTNSLIFKSK
ncbi:glycerophosphodiester phosphodiesterase [Ancylothrix sp. C2]|uniref:glycerophosphodiester phosphodiesterase n=1 Tax=Ancylothrix sp. D3o TaxID=2953691 RepID=UPI0021BA8562|nr:glycerophosphodiester phosphodiesterase family protein [Ancylothrix sp. D3o]MCT7949833.1 glycerophosphodiester phosphodiesterase [Ancylothrix sp. D3o]